MEYKNFQSVNLLDFGHSIQISGIVYSSENDIYLTLFPDENAKGRTINILELSQNEWKKIIRQTDLMETEIISKASDGKLAKIVIRKSTRIIEQGISWAVFRRDDFRCRYCGADKVPLTVDHLILWEEGGPSVEENLVACCRKCNKIRGNMDYSKWIESSYYKKVSRNISQNQRIVNLSLIEKIKEIPKREHSRSR